MPQKKKPDEDTRSQKQKFKDLAREVGADMDEEAMNRAIGVAGSADPVSKKEALRQKQAETRKKQAALREAVRKL